MKVLWCWRCRMDIPMLDAEEAERVFSMQNRGLSTLTPAQLELIHRDCCGDPSEVEKRLASEREYGGMLREYERITGYHETNPMALWHHKIDLYGPPCQFCGKPLRSPDASMCGSCMKPVPDTSR